ncbi:MAG: sulfatase-like hydrolase/transferase [Fuerstiella sp.]|nr:sulfatase-like hydrolase/transferase [Fuerstiella sp.]
MGRLLSTLQKSGKAENTLVLFLSDNGAAFAGGLQPSNDGFHFKSDGDDPAFRRDGVRIQGGSGPDNLPGQL